MFKDCVLIINVALVTLVSVVSDADDGIVKRRDAARKKDSRKDRKDKGYVMFEEEDSEEELVADDAIKYANFFFIAYPFWDCIKRKNLYLKIILDTELHVEKCTV